MFFGAVLALLLVNASDIIREDGSRVILMKNPSWQSELWGLYETLKFQPLVILLFPMFFVSNWFYVYQQNSMNGAYFDVKTRALNSTLYWLAQIITAVIWGYGLDVQGIRRSVRAKIALGVLFVLTMVIWGGGYDFEKTYTRVDVNKTGQTNPDGTPFQTNPGFQPKTYNDSGYIGPMFLYMFYGAYDAAWQATVYWYALYPVCFSAALLTRQIGSWALCPTPVVAPQTLSDSTRASNPSVLLWSITSTRATCRTRRNSSATGFSSACLLSLLLPLFSQG